MSKMAVSGEFSLSENGAKQIHPYLVALMRWCASCLWSAATVLLHRVMMASSMPPITASKQQASRSNSRAASTGHIHPEPRVVCEVLYQPVVRDFDFVFVHGLYGSLENTWRQGDWRSKYKLEPNKIPLRRPSSIPDACNSCECVCNTTKPYRQTNSNSCICAANVDMKAQNRFTKNEVEDYCEGFVDVDGLNIVNNYEMQADFVRKLFDCDANNCSFDEMIDKSQVNTDSDSNSDDNEYKSVKHKENTQIDSEKIQKDDHLSENKNQDTNEQNSVNLDLSKAFDTVEDDETESLVEKHQNQSTKVGTKSCEIGCGCICDQCYSSCWPKDWLSVDFPNARIISINYTSDPHLWRPIWVKECKRLRLHERARQMSCALAALGVGERPVVWVGHSKGGLFIKQIYAEAYEAYLKIQTDQNCTEPNEENEINHKIETDECAINVNVNTQNLDHLNLLSDENVPQDDKLAVERIDQQNNLNENYKVMESHINNLEDAKEEIIVIADTNKTDKLELKDTDIIEPKLALNNLETVPPKITLSEAENHIKSEEIKQNETLIKKYEEEDEKTEEISNKSTEIQKSEETNLESNEKVFKKNEISKMEYPKDEFVQNEDIEQLQRIANLWSNTAGFMFYSVPHRGSALADIKTPITARSVELLEISKDCSLVRSLQDRWLRATGLGPHGGASGTATGEGPPRGSRPRVPAVRSLVETNRTLMAVLWLKIVSVESADAGIGALCGVSVDHREICKPSSRCCVLYTELLKLVHAGLDCFKK